jgi:hypothetical protein
VAVPNTWFLSADFGEEIRGVDALVGWDVYVGASSTFVYSHASLMSWLNFWTLILLLEETFLDHNAAQNMWCCLWTRGSESKSSCEIFQSISHYCSWI